MVNQPVLIRDKHKKLKKFLFFFSIIFIILIIFMTIFLAGMFFSNKKIEYVLENPIEKIVFQNTNAKGEVNKEKAISQAITEFNEDYINYILIAMGVGNLHKSLIYGHPKLEFHLDKEIWSSKITPQEIITTKKSFEKKDLIIKISKQEAVKALLSKNIKEFMKKSVYNGNTKIEMTANKIELASKGYLQMYQQLTGEKIKIPRENNSINKESKENQSSEIIRSSNESNYSEILKDINITEYKKCNKDSDCFNHCTYGCINKDINTCDEFFCKCVNHSCLKE